MIKCIYRTDQDCENNINKHCDKPVEYICWGKGYCFEHLKERDKKNRNPEDKHNGQCECKCERCYEKQHCGNYKCGFTL